MAADRQSDPVAALCRDVEDIVRRLGPVAPATIVSEIGRSNTKAVGVALARLKKAGRVKRIGYYGKWDAA